MASLIANSGIQFFKKKIVINPSEDNIPKLGFYEWYDTDKYVNVLEYARFIPSTQQWVNERGLRLNGLISSDGKLITPLPEITNLPDIKILNYGSVKGCNCYTINSLETLFFGMPGIEQFENTWLPLPFFLKKNENSFQFGPTNWARIKLIPQPGNVPDSKREYEAIIAFDTKISYNKPSKEQPSFFNLEESKSYGLCSQMPLLLDFVKKDVETNNNWIGDYLKEILRIPKPSAVNPPVFMLKHLAFYIYFIHYLVKKDFFSDGIELISDKKPAIDVDFVLDIGNSRTCGLLFEGGDFTKVKMLELQDISHPEHKYNKPFDMRLAFHKASFGNFDSQKSNQFVWPSVVRVGDEACRINYHSSMSDDGSEKRSTYSSPKRYLWDDFVVPFEWEYAKVLENDTWGSVFLNGISQQINSDGTLNTQGDNFGATSKFSRRSLMTFVFIEILMHARAQINSFEFRDFHEPRNTPRKIRNVIITCPTAMLRKEQIILRKCATDASVILDRFFANTYDKPYHNGESHLSVNIIPSVRNLSLSFDDIDQKDDWNYDESTCCQLVYLYAEISQRYCNNAKEFFNLYGKTRGDSNTGNPSSHKSITIGSIDIGAGTTDLMICNYLCDPLGANIITPVPLFWDSFYYAGDDMLKNIVQQVILGTVSSICNDTAKINNFFGTNVNNMSAKCRKMRADFNIQVSVPMALHFLELTSSNVEDGAILFDSFFPKELKPNIEILDFFETHFGFRFESIKWAFSKNTINDIIIKTFKPLMKQLSAVLYAYGCDIVLFAGKPTSLKQLEDLILELLPVYPNRIITLNKYRVGRWYPFQDGDGYFNNQKKSLVAVGAMIGNLAASPSGLNGFKLNIEHLKKVAPTTCYIGSRERDIPAMHTPLLTPRINSSKIQVSDFPFNIDAKQLGVSSYRSRTIYCIDKNPSFPQILYFPLTITLTREYRNDREELFIDSITDSNKDDVGTAALTLRMQTISDNGNYWLDTGEFILGVKG